MRIITELSETGPDEYIVLPAAVLERLQAQSHGQRMLPAIAAHALELAKDPDCNINDFAAVVERDLSLATSFLRLANSVLFSTGRQVMDLRQAVVRLGFRQCKHLIMTTSFNSMIKSMSLDEEWIRELLLRHSFTTALLGTHLNRTLKLGFQGEEFTGGLMHDVGRMLLATSYPDRFAEIDPLEFDEGIETLPAEEALICTNHCEVGAWFMIANALPEQLCAAVRFHHSPEQAAPEHRRYVALVAASDHMANYLQTHDEANGYDPGTNAAIQLLEESGVPRVTSRFVECASSLMATAHREAKDMLAF
jgi:HD-like signal output (HDOD) protein